MLSRIANSLLWTGRYLERAQYTARYIHVHCFGALDAPILSRKEFVLDSITTMTGLSYEYPDKGKNINNNELIYRATLDEFNPVSIKASVFKARENARGARDILSSELWESINKFYHCVNAWNSKKMSEDDILGYTEMIVE
ncbi:MAG: alpha-E domain-containing protein, partial [Cytophagaceae bacterium]